MIACVWPSLMVRSTPLRISLGPFPSLPVSTVTCRSRISSVAMKCLPNGVGAKSVVDGVGHVDEHVVAVDGDRVDRHGLGRRRAARLAGAQVEPGPVQPALDLAALDVALRKRDGGVRALVGDRVPVLAAVHDGDRGAFDVDRQRGPVGDLGGAAGAGEGHAVTTFLASSASTVWSSFSSTSGTPILRMMSAKNPCTTRRRASASWMPRDCR